MHLLYFVPFLLTFILPVTSTILLPGSDLLRRRPVTHYTREFLTLKARQSNVTAGNDTVLYNAMISAYTSPLGQSALQQDIANLTNTSLSINQQFISVGLKLKAIDNLRLNTTFAANWSLLQQDYINILWDSRNQASQLASYALDFEDTILPISLDIGSGQPTLTPDQINTLLVGFENDATTFEAAAQATANAFAKLSQDLAIFSGSVQTFAQSQKTAGSAQLDQLTFTASQLTTSINSLNAQVGKVANDIRITILSTAAAAAVFPFFAPFIIAAGAATVAAETVIYNNLKSQLNSAKNQLASTNVQIAQVQSTLGQIAAANATLTSIRTETIPDLTNRIGNFPSIWTAVVTDINQVREYISLAESGNQTPFIVYAQLLNGNSIYTSLGNALNQYASNIDAANITLPSTISAAAKIAPFYISPTVNHLKNQLALYRAGEVTEITIRPL